MDVDYHAGPVKLVLNGALSAAKDLAEDVKEAISSLDETQVRNLTSLLVDAKKNNRKVFVMGEGLSDLVARSFAMRLAEHTYNVYVIGETVTSSVEKDDLFIAVTRSGITPLLVEAAKIAKERAKARIIVVTSTEDTPISKLAECVLMIKDASPNSEATSANSEAERSYLSIQITGSSAPSYRIVFHVAATCILETIASTL